jgi:hypothetical protein
LGTLPHGLHDLIWRQQAGIPFHHLPVGPGGKATQEAAMRELLPRYMQVLSAEFLTEALDDGPTGSANTAADRTPPRSIRPATKMTRVMSPSARRDLRQAPRGQVVD